MKVLYFDCFSGASGDMILGALIDAGLPMAALQAALGSLAIDGWDVTADRVLRTGVTATNFHVGARGARQAPVAEHAHPHRHEHPHSQTSGDTAHAAHSEHHSLASIKAAIDRSALSPKGKARASALFDRLADAEAAVHGVSVERIHLHEVGALDSIIDVVGAVFALEWFGADRIVVSPINVGGGMVRSAHGLFPVPAPATVRLLGDAPVYASGMQAELLTPTGALLLTDYATEFGSLPAMRVTAVGYGAGDRDLPETPNVLRVLVGETTDSAPVIRVVVLECEIDDMNPQIFGALMDRLYARGALDVYYQPVQMKKNRPGTLVTVVGRPADRDRLADVIFAETTTIGIRRQEMDRVCLAREIVPVDTPLGPVRFKVAIRNGRVVNAQPEFDDLLRVAAAHAVPIKAAQAIALASWQERENAIPLSGGGT